MQTHSNLPIIGAGLSGLITATQFPQSKIYEINPRPTVSHKALLRFRSPTVGDMVGIPFKKVKVFKQVFDGEVLKMAPDILDMNNYSIKVTGFISSRSIGDTSTCERYIAPTDFYEELESSLHNRIEYGCDFDFSIPCISTVPLNVMAKRFFSKIETPVFKYKQSHILRFIVPNMDVYQTVYFSDPTTPIYRVSITGDLVMVESVETLNILDDDVDELYVSEALALFGITQQMCALKESAAQRYGKIYPIDERIRKQMILDLTNDYSVYSIGRFATWRNMLLDDLPDDIRVIKNLIRQDIYDKRKSL